MSPSPVHPLKGWPMGTGSMVCRGVYLAPYTTEQGGMILLSIKQNHSLLKRYEVPAGENPFDVLEMMWAELNESDPLPTPLADSA